MGVEGGEGKETRVEVTRFGVIKVQVIVLWLLGLITYSTFHKTGAFPLQPKG